MRHHKKQFYQLPAANSTVSGMALLPVIIGIGVMSIGFFAWAHTMRSALKEQRRLVAKTDLEALRRNLAGKISCKLSLDDPACDLLEETNVALRQAVGSASEVFVEASGTAFNDFFITATCHGDPATGDRILKVTARQSGNLLLQKNVLNEEIDVGCGSNGAATEALCSELGGAWDSIYKCVMPTGLKFREYYDTDGISVSQVVSCDVKDKGTGHDLKTCDRSRPTGAAGTCTNGGAGWSYYASPSNLKLCVGGVYVNLN